MRTKNKPFKFLLIEDNPVDSRVFRQTLSHTNLKIEKLHVSDNLADGISMISTLYPDVIFLDLNLPDSLGINSFRLLRTIAQKIPVIILTAIDDEKLAKEALREGAQDYLLKNQLSSNLLTRSVNYSVERKEFENELYGSKATTEALIENTRDGIWSVDRNYRFITINSVFRDSYYRISGHVPIIGESLPETIGAKYSKWFKMLMDRGFNGEQFTEETSFAFGSTTLDVEISVNPILGKDASPEGISFFARNISDRKVAERTIRQSEYAYRLLLDNISEGVVHIDNDGIIRFVNKQFLAASGYKLEEVNGIQYSSLLQAGEKSDEETNRSLRHSSKVIELQIMNRSGIKTWFRVRSTPLHDDQGVITGTLLTHAEITEQKEAQEKIRRKEEDYRALVETMHEGLLLVNSSGEMMLANSRFFDITGYDKNSLQGKTLPQEMFQIPLTDLLERDVTETMFEHYETQVHTKDGSSRWCLFSYSIIRNKNGEPDGLLATLADIHDKKMIEEKLKSARNELQTFIYRSSHDLKGPLSSILGLTDLLRKENASKVIHDYNEMIHTSAEKLNIMLEQLLNVVRIRREKIFPKKINFAETIRRVLDKLKSSPDFDSVRKKIKISNNTTFKTDPDLLFNILHNLIDNAIKFSAGNPGRIASIEVSDFLKGVMIRIEDNGKGIDEQARNNMFFMFNRGSNSSKGNGLGLYVVRNAIDRLGGVIEFSSLEEKFTRFEIYLPDLSYAEKVDDSIQEFDLDKSN